MHKTPSGKPCDCRVCADENSHTPDGRKVEELGLGSMFSLYLMSSYLYYEKDTQVLSNGEFDYICARLLEGWDNFAHPHKHLADKEAMEAGTGYQIKQYPTMIKCAALSWADRNQVKVGKNANIEPPVTREELQNKEIECIVTSMGV